MKIRHLDGRRLRRSLVAGCDFVQQQRAELNRINVFPVPDGDTGTNLALTASAIADRLRNSKETKAGAVAELAADAAILGARGNCGMILSHFLLGFSEKVRSKRRLTTAEFSIALQGGVDHVYNALEKPVEGTIITVMRATADAANEKPEADFNALLERILGSSKDALARTPDLLPMLRKAGVVDAGAKGFVHILEGIVSFMRGDPFVALKAATVYGAGEAAAGKVEYPTEAERYRFCTEALVRGEALPQAAVVQGYLRTHGDSLIVIRGQDVLKVHVHTDAPEDVFSYLRSFGTLLTHKAEDMAAQHQAVERANASHVLLARRPLSIVTDSACDLPEEIVRAHGIHVVPMTVIPGEAGRPATTSQPAPAAFLEYYRRAAQDGEEILCLPVASSLSGTFASAEAAAKRFNEGRITMIDTCGASLTQGMLVLRACELAELGNGANEIAGELKRIRRQSGIMFTVDVFDNLLRSGRVGRGKAMLAGWLGIKPILELNEEGRVLPLSRVRGMERALPRMIEVLQQRIPAKAKALRFGVIHVDCPEVIDAARGQLNKTFGEREIITASATPVIATHLGAGAWGLCWQLED